MTPAAAAAICFTEQDLADFGAASGDRNPLHLDPEYARHTPYGQPVVFGCLGAIACLGHIHIPPGWSVTSLDAEFLRPMFRGVHYRIDTSGSDGKWKAQLLDGSTVTATLKVIAESTDTRDEEPAAPHFEHRQAAAHPPEEISPGLATSGKYACDPPALTRLLARWGATDRRLGTALCWASYLVGMELPGETALFSRFVLNFSAALPWPGMLAYQASVVSVDTRVGRMEANVALLDHDTPLASGQCWAYIRTGVPELDEGDYTNVQPDSLAGRTALVLGSSRGLGAALQRALELRGAAVYGLSRSANGSARPVEVGDASDSAALRRLRERIVREHGRLDFLVCNACPPILPLRLEPNGAERISAYINEAVALTLIPLSEFLDLLNAGEGCAVIISSAAVDNPSREWPHYVAAKTAVETLGRMATLQYPRVRTLIVRPPKLLTTMTNTPMGRMGAVPVGPLANRIAARLQEPFAPGTTETLD